MDHNWAAQQLTEFVDKIDEIEEGEKTLRMLGDGHRSDEISIPELEDTVHSLQTELKTLEPAIQILMDAVDPELRSYVDLLSETDAETMPLFPWRNRWQPARGAALSALGLHTHGAEAKRRMRPDSPDLTADQLHPWVWDTARPMWEAGSPQTAVQHAASAVNFRLQQKVGRHDISDKKLCDEAFASSPPGPERPRLRFPGDRTTETWKSLQNGAASFGSGCFMAIRNPLAHDHQFPLTQREALEQLAALSVLARWIDSCGVEIVEEGENSN